MFARGAFAFCARAQTPGGGVLAAAGLAFPIEFGQHFCRRGGAASAGTSPAPQRLESEASISRKLRRGAGAASAATRRRAEDAAAPPATPRAAAPRVTWCASSSRRRRFTDPVARKLARLGPPARTATASAAEYRAFLEPIRSGRSARILMQRMRSSSSRKAAALRRSRASSSGAAPDAASAMRRSPSANLAEGNKAEAQKLAAKAWREMPIPATLETGFLNRFGDLLSEPITSGASTGW